MLGYKFVLLNFTLNIDAEAHLHFQCVSCVPDYFQIYNFLLFIS